jgi:2-keto-4-pentenoate hydratase/2-oxohepta-3-ene-1,7-dioic acid hydratase in catechol pathway
MKLVLFQKLEARDVVPGLLTGGGWSASPTSRRRATRPSWREARRPALERRAREADPLPLSAVRLRAPLPRPGKILACIANYWEHGALEARARGRTGAARSSATPA